MSAYVAPEKPPPLSRNKPMRQVAALCLREGEGGRPEILLISSLHTGRWILPKGWPIRGHTLAESAQTEAWEEAGVRGVPAHSPLGQYSYRKITARGQAKLCTVQVFPIQVDSLADRYPEAGKRRRQWVGPETAATLVDEPDLQEMLRAL